MHSGPFAQAARAVAVRAGKSALWKDDGGGAGVGLAGDTELFPYVSLTLHLDAKL